MRRNPLTAWIDLGNGGEAMVDGKLRPFLWAAAIITIFNGISYVLVPQALSPTYGVEPTAGAVLGFRFLGSILLAFGLILWFVRKLQDLGAASRRSHRGDRGQHRRRVGFVVGDADRGDEWPRLVVCRHRAAADRLPLFSADRFAKARRDAVTSRRPNLACGNAWIKSATHPRAPVDSLDLRHSDLPWQEA